MLFLRFGKKYFESITSRNSFDIGMGRGESSRMYVLATLRNKSYASVGGCGEGGQVESVEDGA